MTTGDPTLADQPNNSSSSGVDLSGGSVRGNTDFDVTMLKIDLAVPAGANCLALDFQFLTEEFPEFVGSNFNDAFIAELDSSTWTTSGSTISAPNNFAFDPSGDVISVNSSGVTSMTAGNASGTTYDGATPLLSAATPITAGAHSLYLSIFDQGDHILDSAVFVDNLILGSVGPGGCQRGATVLSTSKTADSATTPPGGANGYTITVSNQGSSSAVVTSISDTLPNGFSYTAGSTTGATTADPAVSGQTLTWAGPFSVPGAGSVSIHFLVTVSSTPGDYLNNASADAGPTPVTPTGPTAQITVTAGADLSMTKADAPDPVALGGTLTYTLTVTNNGPDASTDSTVTDTLPAGVTFVSATPSQGSCAEAGGTVTCPLGPLMPGASATIEIVVTVDVTAVSPLSDTATVAGVETDPVATNNSATAETAISAPTELDHFKCYKTKQVGTKFDPRQVVLTDQFNTERVNVVRPEAFCTPADKDGSGITNPSAHLTCYKIRDVRGDEFPKFKRRRVEVGNQFGTQTLLLKKTRTLCLPSAKTVL
ncbi:MAG TPA: choice-of-anchor L domain-containing protein [Gaiellaceae bacterium]